jgi:hypothetical protein
MSERRACRLVNQPRGTQRYQLTRREDEDRLTGAIIELASQYGRYGYRRITALLKWEGWQVGKDRVERIWRREGLKVLQRQKPRRRLWLPAQMSVTVCVELFTLNYDDCYQGIQFTRLLSLLDSCILTTLMTRFLSRRRTVP